MYFLKMVHCNLIDWHDSIFLPKMSQTATGIPIGPISGIDAKEEEARNVTVIPNEAIRIQDEKVALYIQAIFALNDPYIYMFTSFFASVVFSLLKCIETNWSLMCQSIETGKIVLPPDFTIDADLLADLNKLLPPNPARADELRSEFANGTDGFAVRVWPRLQIMSMVVTGTMSTYATLIEKIYAPGVKHNSIVFTGTEGIVGKYFYSLFHSDGMQLLLSDTFREL